MPTRPLTRCSACKQLHDGLGRCVACAARADQGRGSAAVRGYGATHRARFRAGVLEREPACPCGAPATVADHWPLSRRQLVAQGLDPDDPDHGRGLCALCHNRSTANNQPGGWNRR